ncbi:globin [Pseudoflavitalea sp. G-6-1-2]|uniref:group II truncated hemoglobin n=1 Tax=Pseudoflavitalea sp. G-6-1-2 TaxID=2728841 RepID=UPI00146C4C86|nr:group II truncated hemoglobin [Pseudoflavitalea sp. G-6-1-2]NML20863.1 globin [Pseudoflavitalea sp. G-6-1-2]
MKNIPTLFEWTGGDSALFEKLTEQFYKKVLDHPLLEPVFRHMSPEHSKHVAHFIVEVFGGPSTYTQDDKGSHSQMVMHHIGKRLTEEMRQTWMRLLLETADETGLPIDPEFRSALVGYLEWGSRIAVINSNTESNPVSPEEPMPKWGWGVPGGPYQP